MPDADGAGVGRFRNYASSLNMGGSGKARAGCEVFQVGTGGEINRIRRKSTLNKL